MLVCCAAVMSDRMWTATRIAAKKCPPGRSTSCIHRMIPLSMRLTECLRDELEEYETDSLKIIMTVRDGKNDQKYPGRGGRRKYSMRAVISWRSIWLTRTEPSNIIKMAKNGKCTGYIL